MNPSITIHRNFKHFCLTKMGVCSSYTPAMKNLWKAIFLAVSLTIGMSIHSSTNAEELSTINIPGGQLTASFQPPEGWAPNVLHWRYILASIGIGPTYIFPNAATSCVMSLSLLQYQPDPVHASDFDARWNDRVSHMDMRLDWTSGPRRGNSTEGSTTWFMQEGKFENGTRSVLLYLGVAHGGRVSGDYDCKDPVANETAGVQAITAFKTINIAVNAARPANPPGGTNQRESAQQSITNCSGQCSGVAFAQMDCVMQCAQNRQNEIGNRH
jgi:hypothetical protein